jgi:acyl carrier protein
MQRDVQDDLMEFVVTRLLEGRDVPGLSVDTLLFEDRFIDSMNILTLIGYIERAIGRRLTDEEIVMSNFKSVKAMTEAFFS